MPYLARPDGARIFYRLHGHGEPCLVMHGGLGLDHTCMWPFLNDLGTRFRLCYYDHRGNGRSSRNGADTMTYDDLLADADALRADVLHAERTAVIASSYGGFVALQYALRYSERVSRLVLIGTAPTYGYFDEIRAAIRRRGGTKAQLEILACEPEADDAWTSRKFLLLGRLYLRPAARPSLVQRVLGRTRWSGVAGRRGRELSAAYDIRDRLSEICAPTLIAVGAHDFVTPPSQARLLRSAIPGSRLAIFESGHFPHAEVPRAFSRVVRNWLDTDRRSRGRRGLQGGGRA